MYTVEVKKRAMKEIVSFPKKDQERIFAAFGVLRENPLAGKILEGRYKGFRSLRVWPYRIVYDVNHGTIIVTVLKVAHRKDAYR